MRNPKHKGPIMGKMHGPKPHRGGHVVRGRAALVNRYVESPYLMRIRWVVEGIKY
jgi:hypothetical protein